MWNYLSHNTKNLTKGDYLNQIFHQTKLKIKIFGKLLKFRINDFFIERKIFIYQFSGHFLNIFVQNINLQLENK